MKSSSPDDFKLPSKSKFSSLEMNQMRRKSSKTEYCLNIVFSMSSGIQYSSKLVPDYLKIKEKEKEKEDRPLKIKKIYSSLDKISFFS